MGAVLICAASGSWTLQPEYGLKIIQIAAAW